MQPVATGRIFCVTSDAASAAFHCVAFSCGCLRLFITAVSSASSSEVAVAMLVSRVKCRSDSLTRDARASAVCARRRDP